MPHCGHNIVDLVVLIAQGVHDVPERLRTIGTKVLQPFAQGRFRNLQPIREEETQIPHAWAQ